MNDLMNVGTNQKKLEMLIDQKISKAYHYDARQFLEYIKAKGYSLADPDGWRAWTANLKNVSPTGHRLKASSYNKKLHAMKALIRIASAALEAREKVQIELELQSLKPAKIQDPDRVCLTPREVKLLIHEANEPWWGKKHSRPKPKVALWIEWLWETGMRVSEMLNIALSDLTSVNKQECQITFSGKGNKQRTIRVPKTLVSRVKRVFQGKQYLFESRNSGRRSETDHRYRREYVSTEIHRLGKKVLDMEFGAHTLRHSSLTQQHSHGVPLDQVRQIAGHSNVTITQRYLHGRVNWDLVRKALELT